jgi:hypothetical protein
MTSNSIWPKSRLNVEKLRLFGQIWGSTKLPRITSHYLQFTGINYTLLHDRSGTPLDRGAATPHCSRSRGVQNAEFRQAACLRVERAQAALRS